MIPGNLAERRFTHFTPNNIDINEGKLHGQNTFHAMQYATWQRGPESVGILQSITPTKRATLNVPDEMSAILPVYIREKVQQNRSSRKMSKRNGLSNQ